jgi:hypothetical protein
VPGRIIVEFPAPATCAQLSHEPGLVQKARGAFPGWLPAKASAQALGITAESAALPKGSMNPVRSANWRPVFEAPSAQLHLSALRLNRSSHLTRTPQPAVPATLPAVAVHSIPGW